MLGDPIPNAILYGGDLMQRVSVTETDVTIARQLFAMDGTTHGGEGDARWRSVDLTPEQVALAAANPNTTWARRKGIGYQVVVINRELKDW